MSTDDGGARTALVASSVLELIGATPLIRLRRMTAPGAATVWAKCEHLSPGGSVKDRIALAMIELLEREHRLERGAWIVEPTSGNTGIGLAIVCAVKGYRLALTMPASMSLERRQLLHAYGAEIVLTEPELGMHGAIERAKELAHERGGFIPMQFASAANPEAHERTTAREIHEALEGRTIDALVAAVGTGGTISGVGRVLKRRSPRTRVIAVEPDQSPVLRGGAPGPTKIQGIGAGFVPLNLDRSVLDEIRGIADRRAWETKQRLAREEGLLVGISSGANVAIALDVAEELGRTIGPHATVVTVLCDTGERYFSLAAHFEESR
jgi:cysteine synthase A